MSAGSAMFAITLARSLRSWAAMCSFAETAARQQSLAHTIDPPSTTVHRLQRTSGKMAEMEAQTSNGFRQRIGLEIARRTRACQATAGACPSAHVLFLGSANVLISPSTAHDFQQHTIWGVSAEASLSNLRRLILLHLCSKARIIITAARRPGKEAGLWYML